MMLKFGEIAEAEGDTAPSVIGQLTSKEIERVDEATPDAVYSILSKMIQKLGEKTGKGEEETVFPYRTLEEIEEFSEEKLRRWYAILLFGSAKKLCKALSQWFRDNNLLETK
jgi:hypothetical protein